MAKPAVLSLSLCFLVLFNGCLAFRQQSRPQHQLQQQQNQCDISNFEALEPSNRIDCEAGRIESWDTNNEQFQCAGVAMVRYTIESNGLLLPSFSNAPQLMYILQGKGTQGGIAPGCPETYQSFPEQAQIRGQHERGQSFQDQHQKIRKIRQGDIIAMPAGVAHWIYNDGQDELVAVVFYDTTSSANQLDVNPRNFFLAGNPQDEFETQQSPRHSRQSQGSCNNIFCGFDVEMLAEAFNVDIEIAKKLQSPKDGRNNIVKVEGELQMVKPRWTREEQQQMREEQEQDNGLEETYCSMRVKENIGDPSRADIFTPQAGRLATVNSNKLPVLRRMRLSAEKGVLYQNAMMAPHWNLNAHSVIYVSRGRARIQIVDNNGEKVFDEDLTKGQVVTVPQNFAVVKRAESEGFEWVAFKTNDNAIMNNLAGQTSVMRGLPVQVIANSYQISPEQARKLKYNRMETFLFNLESSPRTRE